MRKEHYSYLAPRCIYTGFLLSCTLHCSSDPAERVRFIHIFLTLLLFWCMTAPFWPACFVKGSRLVRFVCFGFFFAVLVSKFKFRLELYYTFSLKIYVPYEFKNLTKCHYHQYLNFYSRFRMCRSSTTYLWPDCTSVSPIYLLNEAKFQSKSLGKNRIKIKLFKAAVTSDWVCWHIYIWDQYNICIWHFMFYVTHFYGYFWRSRFFSSMSKAASLHIYAVITYP